MSKDVGNIGVIEQCKVVLQRYYSLQMYQKHIQLPVRDLLEHLTAVSDVGTIGHALFTTLFDALEKMESDLHRWLGLESRQKWPPLSPAIQKKDYENFARRLQYLAGILSKFYDLQAKEDIKGHAIQAAPTGFSEARQIGKKH
uniref:Ciliary neurotrophic factor n=1 Tax=Panagrolaimus sp. JU765 TaxID=591449 RepID=A0AC34R0H0_9BILA